jgi:hypothetical protein
MFGEVPPDLNRERYLVQEHTRAASHYRWAVDEVIRMVNNGENTANFRQMVVAPARDHCQALLREWLNEYYAK